MKFTKDSKEWAFFQDFWLYAQKHYEPTEADEFWREAVKESGKIIAKYGNKETKVGRMAIAMLLALNDFLDNELKTTKNKKGE